MVVLHLSDDDFSDNWIIHPQILGGPINCPKCESSLTIKNGSRKNEKQNFKCLSCGRQFVANPSPHYQIPQETMDLVDRLLLEKIPLAGIAGSKSVRRWLQTYANAKYEAVPQKAVVTPKKKAVLQSSVMKCGHLSEIRKINSGFG